MGELVNLQTVQERRSRAGVTFGRYPAVRLPNAPNQRYMRSIWSTAVQSVIDHCNERARAAEDTGERVLANALQEIAEELVRLR